MIRMTLVGIILAAILWYVNAILFAPSATPPVAPLAALPQPVITLPMPIVPPTPKAKVIYIKCKGARPR